MAPDETSIAAVTAELAELGERLIDRVFERVLKRGPLELPYLFELAVQHFRDQWQQDKPSALELLLSTAIRRLPADELFERSKMPLRQAAYMAFNIAAPEYNVDKVPIDLLQGKKNSALYKRLMDAAEVHLSAPAFRKPLTALRKRLAKILLDPDFPFLSEGAELPGRAGAFDTDSKTDSLIARPKDLAWLHESYGCLSATGGIFMLWGLAGMGKTTLVRQFAREIGPEQAIGFIRIGRRGLYEEDIRRVLRLEGHDESLWTDAQCHAMLRTTANQLRTIRLLVLDDVRMDDDINVLLPRGCNVPVVVTTREHLWLTETFAGTQRLVRQIVEPHVIESARFLVDQLSFADKSTLLELHNIVGGHPETTAHVARYLSTEHAMSPEALLDALSREAEQTLSDLTEILNAPPRLSAVVRQLYKQIPDHSLASAILACLAWVSYSGEQHREVVIEMVSQIGERPSELQLAAALNQLERLGLVNSGEKSFRVSRLTHLVLRDILTDVYDSVLLAYERVIAVSPNGDKEQSHVLRTLRAEYDATRPMQPKLAEMLGNREDQLPAFVCLDEEKWALFVTVSDGTRLVTVYLITAGALLSMRPDQRKWQVIPDVGSGPIVDAMRDYADLITKAWMKEASTPEKRVQIEKEWEETLKKANGVR